MSELQTTGATTFAYDTAIEAATATVDGHEVLAPLREGAGFKAQVIPRSAPLASLLATQLAAGELAYPTDAAGIVQGTGGAPRFHLGVLLVDLGDMAGWTIDAASGAAYYVIPPGVRTVMTYTSMGSNIATPLKGMVLALKCADTEAPRMYRLILLTNAVRTWFLGYYVTNANETATVFLNHEAPDYCCGYDVLMTDAPADICVAVPMQLSLSPVFTGKLG